MCSGGFSSDVRVAHRFSFWCCVFVLSSFVIMKRKALTMMTINSPNISKTKNHLSS
jgi:hypothetical protein